MNLPSDSRTPDKCLMSESSRSQSPWNALRNGFRKSAFLPYKASVTVLTNLQRGNTEAHTPIIEAEELNFHQKAAQGDLTIKDIKQEPDIDAVDEDGLTPLMWASAYGQYPIVDALLQSSAKIDLENSQGQTALLFAAYGGYHEVVRLLIANGADVNHRDQSGNTALIYAATGNNPHTTNELLSRNADFSILNVFGESAYIVAVKKENYVEYGLIFCGSIFIEELNYSTISQPFGVLVTCCYSDRVGILILTYTINLITKPNNNYNKAYTNVLIMNSTSNRKSSCSPSYWEQLIRNNQFDF